MPFRVLADLVVLAHLAFVLFAVLGGILVRWWRRSAWVRLKGRECHQWALTRAVWLTQ